MPEDDRTLGDILSKILISRGAPRENYSGKAHRVKLLWWPTKLIILSSKQIDIISLLIDTINSFESYETLSIEERYKNAGYTELLEQHRNEILEAVRAGLIWHPLVSEFVYTRKALGDKEYLRKIKRGWETGFKRPLTINDLKFINRLEKIAQYREESKTWPQIRQILMRKKIINKMSWQALQKKFEKAWIEEWEKVNKRAPFIP
ncbi:MAG: hypothetical protein NTY36_00640 [Deltaproteobacteria bacterium]|nr:hypothetical protein [Deltaproteobacteria bacterium]